MNMKQSLWQILEKYDCKENRNFCDSLSRIIQSKEDNEDILNVFIFLKYLDSLDKSVIENTVGSKIDSLLFSF
jgi:hypothetical protein